MSAIVKDLENKEGIRVYPTTLSQAVYMPDNRTTVFDELEMLREDSSVTEFNTDGTITKTLGSGKIITTSFESDGSIVETCRYPEGDVYYVKTTTFESDGSIKVDVRYEGSEQA